MAADKPRPSNSRESCNEEGRGPRLGEDWSSDVIYTEVTCLTRPSFDSGAFETLKSLSVRKMVYSRPLYCIGQERLVDAAKAAKSVFARQRLSRAPGYSKFNPL